MNDYLFLRAAFFAVPFFFFTVPRAFFFVTGISTSVMGLTGLQPGRNLAKLEMPHNTDSCHFGRGVILIEEFISNWRGGGRR